MGKWEQEELPFHKAYKEAYHPHQMNAPQFPKETKKRKEEFYSAVSKKQKPDPATVEAILQEEENLWES